MRIAKVRIAGFKSFVDPTTLHLPENLTGVVGPNGCGKSNIVDALLWVLGESSAKHLRGDSMADVVFNGSSSRKPVGLASVELVFDNTDGLIAGPYAAYSEIAIRRTVNREGVSTYYLNGARCRRMDITNLFLGTGVGARSYSVIEQGMISRVVESRPEELRTFLEEAAGISKYKVRRRDTEHRVQNTRDNLARLDDIRQELDKQLTRLQQQARAAERFQELKAEQRGLEVELVALRLRGLLEASGQAQARVEERDTAVEAGAAALRAREARLVAVRAEQSAVNERFSAVQAEFYQAGAAISTLRQSLEHLRQTRERLETGLEGAREQAEALSTQHSRDARRRGEAERTEAELVPAFDSCSAESAEAARTLAELEARHAAWQSEWDTVQEHLAEATRREQLDQSRLDHLVGSEEELDRRTARLEQERAQLCVAGEQSLQSLEEALAQSGAEVEGLEQAQQAGQTRIREQRERGRELAGDLANRRTALQRLQGRLASLEALQQAALGNEDVHTARFLDQHGLQGAPRLAERLQIEPGWEWALEVVLGLPLDTLCVDDLESLVDRAGAFDGRAISALHSARVGATEATGTPAGARTLAQRLLSASPVDDLLARVRTAESLPAARALLPGLAPGESVVTADGCWLGQGWLRIEHPADAEAPLLERERQLRALREELLGSQREVEEAETRLQAAHGQLAEAEQNVQTELAPALRVARERHSELRSDLAAGRARREQSRQRLARIDEELARLAAQRDAERQESVSLGAALEALRERGAELRAQREQLRERRDALREALEGARRRDQALRTDLHEMELRLSAARLQARTAAEALARSEAQLQDLAARRAQLEQELTEVDQPRAGLERELEQALQARLTVEGSLREARTALESLDQEIRKQERARTDEEQEAQRRRDALEAARVDARALEVRASDLRQQLQRLEGDYATLAGGLPADAVEADWTTALERVQRRIQRLGAINLAAIGEFQQLSERKGYLDAQHEDLSEALATLEEAMRKIDRETRNRFKETFDKVNNGLQAKFPLLFGGGHAYLDLGGEDLLEAGVSVMARPPGKRNGTIHLLSGGEKALTAVALVFAIFDLNPAPFCLLDEVDAPLDDANVVRLCDMVKSMSDRVQFVFITHNKITMELANRLIGVTMQEPGVSRLVAVDMDQAVQLAATA